MRARTTRERGSWWRIVLFLAGIACFGGNRAAAPQEEREAARSTFAQLLKIPLEAPEVQVRVQSTRTEEGLTIEDVEWESLDGQRPLAFVIRPVEAEGPLPAVVCLHGSSGSRESMTTARFGPGEWTRYGATTPHRRLLGWARELARRGYFTLALTQRGLDRRLPDTNDQSKEMLVWGRTLMGAIVYEIRQAVSYLAARPDVDPRRIGMTGMSFGGITTFYTWLVDDRVTAAAPICGGVGSVEVFLKEGSRSYHGLYWWVPGMLREGDQGDFAAAMAPRPLMLWAPLQDVGMPAAGVDHFLERAEPAYRRAGASEHLRVHRPPGGHEFSLEAFETLADFFDRYLHR